MNNQSEFNQDANIFSGKDALNQNTGDTIGSIELEASPSQLDGAFRSPLESEPIELSAVAQRVSESESESESELFPRSPTSYVDSDYAVFAGGKLTVKGQSDFDGDPLLAADDAKIYAAEGFEVSGSSTFPVLRDETGDAVLDADGKQQLLDNALVVTEGYKKAEAKGSQNKISGLIPPQVVETKTINVPAYRDLVVDELAQRLPAGTPQNTFNAKRNRIRNAKDWNNLFPDGGTPENPTYVRVTEGKLEIPNKVDLSNYVIIVNRGDIQFKGSNNELDNVVLLAEDGKIETKKLQANNVSFFASDKIEIKSGSQFTGENLIANGKGKIEFRSAAVTPSETDSLTIVSAEDLELRSSSRIRGQLIARDDLRARGNSTFHGQLIAQDDLNISGRVEVYAVPSNEPQPEIVASIDSVTVEEGDDTTAAQLTVSLSRASETEVALDYTTSDDSAVAGTDYQSVADTIIFDPGETSKAIEVSILDDNVNEPDEAFEVQLTNPNSVVLDNSTAFVDIIDNDPVPAITLANVEVDEAAGTAELTVSLANPSSREVAVDFATVDGEALAGTDYQSVADTLIFEPGETEKTIAVTIFDDGIYELDEPFTLELSSPSNGEIATGEATATIIDNEPITDVAINSVMVTEGEDSFANFEVTLSQPSAIPITVDFTAEEGTASSNSDFNSFNGSITFEPGETSKTVISIPVNDDNLDEVDEFFTVRLDNPVNAEILNDSGTATIGDNDNPPELSIADTEVAEGNEGETNVSFVVSLDAPSGKEITVDYATEDDTATAGSDYTAATGTLTFEEGETTQTVDVAVSGDIDLEADEAFNLILSNPSNATLEPQANTATGTIINDDLAIPSLSLSLLEDTGIDTGDNISSNATITGSVNNLGDDVVLSASLNDGEAVEFDDEDLVQPDGSFTLGIEQLRELNGNDLDDGSFTLQLTATNPQTGDTQSQSISFVLDTTAPNLNLTAPIADGDHSNRSRLTGTIFEANLADLSYSLDDGESQTVTVDEANSFDAALGSEGLEAGEHTVEAVATDIAGNQTATSVSFEVGESFFTPNGTTGWGAKNEDTVILGEGNSYVTQTTVPIELGLETNEDGELVGTRTISFDLDAVWGDAKPSLGEDQLQVYLMDANNPTQTILDNGIEGTPVFSIAGSQADFTPGLVNFNGTTVTIDASSLSSATAGTLVFQLLNNDEDTGSVVAVNNLTSTTDPEGFANPVFPETNRPIAPGGELNLDNLTVAPDASASIDNVRFNPATGEYQATVSIINNGETRLSRNTAIVFDNLPDGVELIDPSGIDADGNPYLNFRPGIASGGLDVGTVSESVEVVLSNPNLIRFGLDTTILTGSANVAPVFEPIENLTVVPGQKLELDLAASDANGDNVTYRLAEGSELPTGMLDGNGTLKFSPQPDEIGSYEFTIIATDGAEEVTQTVTLNVVADPVTTTRISGIIENVEQEPLAGVPIELGELATVTAADGSFTIETEQPLTADTLVIRGEEIAGSAVYPYIAEKLPLVLGQEVFAGFNNVIDRPIYLPALDVESGSVIDPTKDITVTTENIPGASVTVKAGSLSTQSGEAFTGTLSITEVPAELTPAALPENLIPDTVVTIQPGEMVFDTPAPLSFPNRANHPPGTEMDLWSINPETGDFDKVGKMLVSDDGSVIETIEGGIINSSWHFPAPPPPEPQDPEDEDRNEEDECERCGDGNSINSFVESHSGALIETHELVTYQSNGEEQSIGLTYDSLRADPRPIVHFGYANVRPDPQVRLTANLRFTGNDFVYQVPGVTGTPSELAQYGLRGGEHLWSIPEGDGSLNASIQADLSQFSSGKYDYLLSTGIRRLEPTILVPNGRSARVSGVSGFNVGDVVHVNSIESAFGSGWGIAGWQEIVENTDGSLLLIDGDGSELVFDRDSDLNDGASDSEIYASPDGDFSTLEKLADGTYRRTLKDGTIYLFNQSNDLLLVTDRNDNQTRYLYDENERLTSIVDSVGLKTTFTYNEAGKVSSIVDPANRESLLSYDESGNLIDITDPDNFSRTWEYDGKHHMIGETDKRGNVEQTFYDFAGRVFQGVRKDGSVNKVNPVQVEGLYRPETTTRLAASPLANRLSEEISSSFVDANGNVKVTELDQAGQAKAVVDKEGNVSSTERNENNLITRYVNGEGIATEYTYDDLGNVLTIEESLSVANNAGGNALVISNAESSSESELITNATETLDLLLEESGFDTTVVDNLPEDTTQYEQIWDLRFDNNAALDGGQTQQYLDFLGTGGQLYLFGENSVFASRNNSILNLVELAGGGELDFALSSPSQKLVAPFNRSDSGNVVYEAPGGVMTPGTGQFITTDEEERGAALFFTQGSLNNSLAGELTVLFDVNFLENSESDENTKNLLNSLTKIENKSVSQSFTYDPIFSQVKSYTDELGRLTLNDIDPKNGNILSTTRVVGEVGGDDDLITSYTYTEAGLIDITTDPLGRVMDYDYDEFGRLIRETSAVGTPDEASMRYEYDAAGNQTAIIDENGNRTEFVYDLQNRVVKVTEADPDGEGELTSPVSSFEYDESGNVIEVVDANNNSTKSEYDELDRLIETSNSLEQETSYEYDEAGNLIAMTDALGRQVESKYDGRDRLTEIIDPLGNSTKYSYDLNDNLTAVIDPLGNTTRNFYDSRDRLFRTIDAVGNVTNFEYDETDNLIATVDANGNRIELEYDELDRQVKQVNALGDEFTTQYDEAGNVVATTDELNRTTNFEYDALDRLIETINAESGITEFDYDPLGNLLSVTDAEKRTTNFEYDALNRQTTVTDPLLNPTRYVYDAVGNLTSVTDANLNTTKYSYDQLNRVDTVTNALEDTVKTKYDAVGNVIGITDELGRITTIAYEERDLPKLVTDALGNTTTTQYDAVGSAISVTDARNNTTNYEYDKLRRLIKEIDATGEDVNYVYDPVGNLIEFSDELDRTTTFGYDALNRRTTVTDPLLHTTTTEYDKVSNLVSIIDANKHATAYSYDLLNRPTVITNHLGETIETEYDKVGNVTAVTDELKRTTRFEYDDRNLQTSITDPLTQTSTTEYDAVGNAISVTDPLLNKTTYNYDPLYRLTGQTDAESRTTTYSYDPVSNLLSLTDPEQNTTSYTYDDVNRLLTDTNQLGHTRTFEYDEIGNRIASIDRNGREINYTFDALNRNTAETWLDENNNPIRTFNYQFDAASQLLNANDPDSAYSYDYDLDGRVTSINNAGTFGVPEVVFDYTYDPVDNLTAVNDSIDGVEAGIETFAYDELDRVTSITQSGNGVVDKRVDYSYDSASQRKDITRYSDLEGTTEVAQTSYSFDDAGRLTDLTHDSNGEVLSASQWAYDQANRITQATTPDGISDYDYDKTDQLVDADHNYQDDESYVYDSNGNRVNDGYVTGENNQLESDGTFTYEYDAEGNRVKRTEIATGEVTEYEWDFRNRLVAVETVDREGDVTSNSEYTYDVFDRRIAKSVDADGDGAGTPEVERFVYDGDHIALTFDGEGNQTERFLHGLEVDEVLAQENESGEVLWALADHQGSVRMLLDNEGNVVNEISYDAFGNITLESNPDVNFRFSYTGRELDEETGLYNYRSRYYDPNVGQFINQDTIGFAGGDSNLYRYVANSPLNYTDPFGYFTNGGVQVPTQAPPGTGTTISPSGTVPTIGVPTINKRDLYILTPQEQRRKSEFIREFGNFPGSDNPAIWKVVPEQVPSPYSTPSCLSVPGGTCEIPDENEDFAERVRKAIEEINRENQENQEEERSKPGDSCPNPNYDPQANRENQTPEGSKKDNQPESNQNKDSGSNEPQYENTNESLEEAFNDPSKFATDIQQNPEKLWGKTAEDIEKYLNDNGYDAEVKQGTKKGTSGLSKQVRIKGHPEIANIQVHPGGGLHGGAYYKFSTTTQGKIKVVDRATYKPTPNEKVKIIYLDF